ncbi:MAG: C45 family peptidase [Clostridium sp.]|nr:C45 family peptidase [Clostridium sp.]
MKFFLSRIFPFIMAMALAWLQSLACTSILVSAEASATGRPLMWKHRDTGAPDNFLARVEKDGCHSYVGLFNGGDSLLREAWMGMNDAGFAIMNTASYNLMPDTCKYADQEGVVMAMALEKCATLADFEALIDSLPKPMGVQANFGVMDGQGGLAYYETDDNGFKRFDVADAPEGFIVRTNFSVSGEHPGGMGYIRYDNVYKILEEQMRAKSISPADLTEGCSRSFRHSLLGRDPIAEGDHWAVDQDFIPRYISTSSIVIEGVDASHSQPLMWAALGYPPCSYVRKVTLDSVPEDLAPALPGWHSKACIEANNLKDKVFHRRKGNGKRYLDFDVLRPINEEMRKKALAEYENQ